MEILIFELNSEMQEFGGTQDLKTSFPLNTP